MRASRSNHIAAFLFFCNFASGNRLKSLTMLTNDIDLALREATALKEKNQIFLVADEHTHTMCLPTIQQTLALPEEQILVLPAGEETKDLATVQEIWDFLIARKATRHSILLILGGGVLTDMAGFAAATFKRGLPFVNIPTTLLGAVDAATGGKTGIDYKGLKNEIGLFILPAQTIIYPPFLKTLPTNQFLSGYAEMLKHALIASPLELSQLLTFDLNNIDQEVLAQLLSRSIDIKNYIVEQDPQEEGLRKTLNFGHTIGHALESFSFHTDHPLLHGYAVLYGMIGELYLSVKLLGFPEKYLSQIVAIMREYYGKPTGSCKDYDELIGLMQHDKKNITPEEISFTLLRNVGDCRLNQHTSTEDIKEALDFLFNL